MSNRNSPKTPKTEISVTEILRSPYRGEEIFGGDFGDTKSLPLEVRKVRTDAKHLSAPKAEKVRIGAESFRTAPIGTCPALDLGTEETNPERWCLLLLALEGQPLPALPAIPGRVYLAPPPAAFDSGHPREASLDRALALAARIADRRHWRHRP